MLKRLVKHGNHHFLFQRKVTTKWKIIEWKRSPKTGAFRLKRESWNLCQRPQLRTRLLWFCLRFSVLFKFGSPDFRHSLYRFVVSNDYAPMPPSLTNFSGARSSREKGNKTERRSVSSTKFPPIADVTWDILFHSRQHSTFWFWKSRRLACVVFEEFSWRQMSWFFRIITYMINSISMRETNAF